MSEMMPCSLELRPVRLAFFIDPHDKAGLLDAIEICTCVWGGMWNPILPLIARTSRRFRQPGGDQPSAEQVVAGFLEVFEPDAVVASDPAALPRSPSLARQPLFQLADMLKGARAGAPPYGVSMLELYVHDWKHSQRFVQRQPEPVVRPVVLDSALEMFTAARWGRLPQAAANDMSRAFSEAYQPVARAWQPTRQPGDDQPWTYPIRLTLAQMQAWTGREASVLLIDHESALDIMAYWSLRASGSLVLAVPLAYASQMMAETQEFIESYHREPDEQGRGEKWVAVRCAAGVGRRAFKSFVQGLAPKRPARPMIDRFPVLWSLDTAETDLPGVAGRLVAGESDVEIPIRDGQITIKPLRPGFLRPNRALGSAAWGNRIRFRRFATSEGGSFVLPPNTSFICDLLRAFGTLDTHPRQTRDGIAQVCQDSTTLRWEVPPGHEVVKWWLGQQGWVATPSSAGLIAWRLIQALGGPHGVSLVANKGLLSLLNSFAGKNRRHVKSREELLSTIAECLPRDRRNQPHGAPDVLKALIERGVLRVGLEVQCTVCRQWNWYPLGAIAPDLSCERCLAQFAFPSSNPPDEGWRYRPVGPFAIEDYAQGGYAVALAVRFFLYTLHGQASWSTGLEMRRLSSDGSTELLEVDGAIFWSRWFTEPGQVLFLEAKSFVKKIAEEDVKRAKQLLTAFPDSIFVFATMRDVLSQGEKGRLRALIRDLPDRHFQRHRVFKPVLILTGVDLFSSEEPPSSWRSAGPPWSGFAQTEVWYYHGLGQLCDASQRLHLDDAVKRRTSPEGIGTAADDDVLASPEPRKSDPIAAPRHQGEDPAPGDPAAASPQGNDQS